MSITDDGDYGAKQVGFLEIIWGEGFLSPGGIEELDLMLAGLNISNKDVLDIGCGCGGAAFHLMRNYKANTVTGIDVEPLVIKRATELAHKYRLTDQTKFEVVDPGPLAFEENQFDVAMGIYKQKKKKKNRENALAFRTGTGAGGERLCFSQFIEYSKGWFHQNEKK